MKLLLLPLLTGISMTPAPHALDTTIKTTIPTFTTATDEGKQLTFKGNSGDGKMACIKFKSQEFCRAELEDFEFDVHFTVVSATVYFSGANFKNTEKGTISGSSLKPIRSLMDRCQPGTRVIFDDVKVKGPDNTIRTIDGLNLLLF
ncbi:GldM family protein [Ferruginibacter sp.]